MGTADIFMSAEHLKVIGDQRVDVLDLDDTDETFMASVERLATLADILPVESMSRPEIVLVVHREGIWELLAAAGLTKLPYMPPYACICQLMFVPPVPQTPDAKAQEESLVAESTISSGWYLAPA